MADALKIYDSNAVTIQAMGILIDSGLADGTFVKVSPTSGAYTSVAGADGQVTRSKTNDKRATVEITLMQTSDANTALSTLYNIDQLSDNGAGVGPLLIKDRSGVALHTASKCWIMKSPDREYGKEATTRVWTLECADLISVD